VNFDLSQFRDVFFEESFEGLAVMEQGLLSLGDGEPDRDLIDAIFRAAHSIKGGAGTFGFQSITGFTHRLETLLDEVRAGRRHITRETREVLLQATDVLGALLRSNQRNEVLDGAAEAAVVLRLDQLLAEGAAAPAITPVGKSQPESVAVTTGWNIDFRPLPHLYRTGNDPLRLIRQLMLLGECEVTTEVTQVPPLSQIEADDSHLAFKVRLAGDVAEAEVRSVFDWVDGDCVLEITPFAAAPIELAETTAEAPVAVRAATPSSPAAPVREHARGGEGQSIRVSIDKVDAVINMVGELVITQSMLSGFGRDFDPSMMDRLRDGLAQLERNTRELQDIVLKIRMLPISVCFSRFPRLVHDLSERLGKRVELKMTGEQTELDKTVLENIGDPLVHLVRNCLDHGIETTERRLAAGKPETGTLTLEAWHEGGSILIQVRDDGAGLNRERILAKAIERGLVQPNETLSDQAIDDIIFLAGFSTADAVSDISGRGVGMDVVRRNIQALGGQIEVRSFPGRGTTFTIRLPLTLAILDGQLVQVGEQVYILPLVSIVESLQVAPRQVNIITGTAEVYRLREDYIPIVRLHESLGTEPRHRRLDQGLLVVVEADGNRVGLFVDDLLSQQQVVIKSLETNYRHVFGVSGATILGDGSVALILDVSALVNASRRERLVHAVPGETRAA
jgi:two-component system, chemotaxis family, sensor kinase CheA